jgi:hypothetical protein
LPRSDTPPLQFRPDCTAQPSCETSAPSNRTTIDIVKRDTHQRRRRPRVRGRLGFDPASGVVQVKYTNRTRSDTNQVGTVRCF